MFTSDEAAQIIDQCKERFMKANIISQPFTATEIQGGILKEYLQDEDYLAPYKVTIGVWPTLANNSLI